MDPEASRLVMGVCPGRGDSELDSAAFSDIENRNRLGSSPIGGSYSTFAGESG